MNQLDTQVEAVAAMLRSAGGQVGFDDKAPDHVKRAFLKMILECPDCRKAMMGRHNGQGN